MARGVVETIDPTRPRFLVDDHRERVEAGKALARLRGSGKAALVSELAEATGASETFLWGVRVRG